MKLIDKLLQVKAKKTLKKLGLDQIEFDFSELTAEDWQKIAAKIQGFVQRHPTLKKIKLDSAAALLQHKEELVQLFEENKEEIEKILQEIKSKKKGRKK